jgi:hypothetical protein
MACTEPVKKDID